MRCIFSSNQNKLVHLSCCFTEWIHCCLGILIYTYFSSVESDLIVSHVSNCGSKILLLTSDETMDPRCITADCDFLRILLEVYSVSSTSELFCKRNWKCQFEINTECNWRVFVKQFLPTDGWKKFGAFSTCFSSEKQFPYPTKMSLNSASLSLI